MKTYADYLRENGATEEEVKLLDHPAARKIYESQQAAAAAAAADAEKRVTDYKTEADKWYNEQILPKYTEMEQRATAAAANEARARALILASQDEGLKKVAKDMGYAPDPAAPPAPNPNAPAFDASKYVTTEQLKGLSDGVGAGLAALQDMVLEHSQLFPDKRLNVRELRAAALSANKDIYSYWQDKYGVVAARDAREKADKEAYEKKLRDEGAAAARSELASQYGNPDLRPMAPSSNPFAIRPNSNRKQPWEEGDRSNERVLHATKAVMDSISSGAPKPN